MCATGAIVLKHYTDEAILDQIDAAIPPELLRKEGGQDERRN
jgi:hypothetical protein